MSPAHPIYFTKGGGEEGLDFGFDAVSDEYLVIISVDACDGEGYFVPAINMWELEEGILCDGK